MSGNGEYGRVWDYLAVQEALRKGLFTGLAICFPASFGVLLFATRNLITAFYAILTIAFIIVSVLGFCSAALGYALGVVETIAAVCVIGFSVDYTVHLAHMYHECTTQDRLRRPPLLHFTWVARCLVEPSPLWAPDSCFGCVLTFFTKMGTIMCLTIFLSYIYSMFFFLPLLAVFGPEGSMGSLQFCLDPIPGCREESADIPQPYANGDDHGDGDGNGEGSSGTDANAAPEVEMQTMAPDRE